MRKRTGTSGFYASKVFERKFFFFYERSSDGSYIPSFVNRSADRRFSHIAGGIKASLHFDEALHRRLWTERFAAVVGRGAYARTVDECVHEARWNTKSAVAQKRVYIRPAVAIPVVAMGRKLLFASYEAILDRIMRYGELWIAIGKVTHCEQAIS